MYGRFTYILAISVVNLGTYFIHGEYGIYSPNSVSTLRGSYDLPFLSHHYLIIIPMKPYEIIWNHMKPYKTHIIPLYLWPQPSMMTPSIPSTGRSSLNHRSMARSSAAWGIRMDIYIQHTFKKKLIIHTIIIPSYIMGIQIYIFMCVLNI